MIDLVVSLNGAALSTPAHAFATSRDGVWPRRRARPRACGADGDRSPLAIRTARATALGTDSGIVIEIRSPYEDDAAEILRRAEALASSARVR